MKFFMKLGQSCVTVKKYLGLLVVVGKSKYNTFRSIKESLDEDSKLEE